MCGLGGFLDRSGLVGDPTGCLEATARALRHRGPDDHGIWFDPALHVGLAHARLEIVGLGHCGKQPMHSASGRFVIAYNGEIYNARELAAAARARGAPEPRGSSDTESLLLAIESCGLQPAVRMARGQFAFALVDTSKRELHLVRDHFGVKPLLWSRRLGAVTFASELGGLPNLSGVSRSINRDALDELLRFGVVGGNQTIMAGVERVPPATILSFSLDNEAEPTARRYWTAPEPSDAFATPPEIRETLAAVRGLIDQAVAEAMAAEVEVGVFLSGGLDSAAVAEAAMRASGGAMRTFTVRLPGAKLDESTAAAATARALGTNHTECVVSPESLQISLESVATLAGEPFGDSSLLATLALSRAVQGQVKCVLTGDGGDEIFGGYRRHWAIAAMFGGAISVPLAVRRVAISALGPLTSLGRKDGAKLTRAMYARTPLALHAAMLSPFDGERLARGVSPRTSPWIAQSVPDPDAVRSAMRTDLNGYLIDDCLTKVDRGTMAASLEARPALLDHRLVEYCLRLPGYFHSNATSRKRLLRRVLVGHVPSATLTRGKTGFSLPVADWLRGLWRPWAESLLSESALCAGGYMEPAPYRKLWEQHLAKTHDHSAALWPALMFEQWRLSTRP